MALNWGAYENGTTHSNYYGVKMTTSETVVPKHYKFIVKGVELDTLDIIQALDLPFEPANALKYITRAGKKTVDKRDDIEKAIGKRPFKIEEEFREGHRFKSYIVET